MPCMCAHRALPLPFQLSLVENPSDNIGHAADHSFSPKRYERHKTYTCLCALWRSMSYSRHDIVRHIAPNVALPVCEVRLQLLNMTYSEAWNCFDCMFYKKHGMSSIGRTL